MILNKRQVDKMNIETVQRIAGRIVNQRHLLAIRDGMAGVMPLIIVGSIFMLIAQFPIPAVSNWLNNYGISQFLNKATNATFGLVGFAGTFTISFYLAKYYKVDGLSAGLLSIASFVLLTPVLIGDSGESFPIQYLGTSGLFVGIIVALISTEIFRCFIQKDIAIKIPDAVPSNVARAFSSIIPGFTIILLWLLVLIGLNLAGVNDIHMMIANTIAKPLQLLTKNLFGVIVMILVQCFFWMFGIHGAQVTAPVIEPLLLQNSAANNVAYQAGQELPNIVTYEFLYNFVFSGGAGCVMALAILAFLFSKSKENKEMGKLSIAPVSFQVAEPLLFGFPTILNIRMLIPFVMAPVVTAIITYFAMYFGWVAKPAGIVVPWTTPPIVAGF